MQNAESRDSRRSRFTSVLASFEAKISAPPVGAELCDYSSGKRTIPCQSGTESGTLDAREAPLDRDLAAVVAAWPSLPAAVKAGIVEMVQAARLNLPSA